MRHRTHGKAITIANPCEWRAGNARSGADEIDEGTVHRDGGHMAGSRRAAQNIVGRTKYHLWRQEVMSQGKHDSR